MIVTDYLFSAGTYSPKSHAPSHYVTKLLAQLVIRTHISTSQYHFLVLPGFYITIMTLTFGVVFKYLGSSLFEETVFIQSVLNISQTSYSVSQVKA